VTEPELSEAEQALAVATPDSQPPAESPRGGTAGSSAVTEPRPKGKAPPTPKSEKAVTPELIQRQFAELEQLGMNATVSEDLQKQKKLLQLAGVVLDYAGRKLSYTITQRMGLTVVPGSSDNTMQLKLSVRQDGEFLVFQLSATLESKLSEGRSATLWEANRDLQKLKVGVNPSVVFDLWEDNISDFFADFERDYRQARSDQRER
jgi:hypothetical protein